MTFLGTGTSTGVPMVACQCPVCLSQDARDKRLRSSVWIESEGQSLLIDTTTDLRAQALREGIRRIDAVLYTHHHADHVHGVDELRVFNYFQNKPIPCYGNIKSLERIKALHGYIFDGKKAEGAEKPKLDLININGPFQVGAVNITPVPVKHGSAEVFGYRINDAAYITDCSFIPEDSMALLRGLKILVLGALWIKHHATHFNMDQALEVADILKPETAYFTHLNHAKTHLEGSAELPEGAHLAWDGLKLAI